MMGGGLEDVLGGEAMIQKMQRLNHVIWLVFEAMNLNQQPLL